MSISSDIYITRKEAEDEVKAELMSQYEALVDLAVKSMEDWELTSKLNTDLYFYNIEK